MPDSNGRIIRLNGCRIDVDGRESIVGSKRHPLTRLEVSLLVYLADRPGETVDRADIETDVWGMASTVLSRAVSQTVSRLRRKIEPDSSRPVNLKTVYGQGWRLMVEETDESEPAAEPREALDTPDFAGEFIQSSYTDALTDRLERGARWVTLTGLPGVGKTRSCVWVLERSRDPRPRWFLDGGLAADHAALLAELARRLRCTADLPSVLAGLEARNGLVLLFDGLVRPSADVHRLLERLLSGIGNLTVLATAYQPAGSRFEQVLAVTGLRYERQDGSGAADGAAARLLSDRVRRRAPHFDFEASSNGLKALSDALGGHPGALELAAGRLALLTPEELVQSFGDNPLQISDRLQDSFVSWWRALSTDEREALVRLSVQSTRFDLEVAHALCSPRDEHLFLDVLQKLLDAGALVRIPSSDCHRFQLPTLVRHLAGLDPTAKVARDEARAAHRRLMLGRWTVDRLDAWRHSRPKTTAELLVSDRTELEVSSMLPGVDKWRLLAALAESRLLAGEYDGALDALDRGLALHVTAVERARLLIQRAETMFRTGDPASALEVSRYAVECAREGGDSRLESEAALVSCFASALAAPGVTNAASAAEAPRPGSSPAVEVAWLLEEARLGRLPAHRERLLELIDSLSHVEPVELRALALSVLGMWSPQIEDVRRAWAELRTLEPRLRGGSWLYTRREHLCFSGHIAFILGDLHAAEAALSRLAEMDTARRGSSTRAMGLALRAGLHAELGHGQLAERLANEAQLAAPPNQDPGLQEWLHWAMMRSALARQSQWEAARSATSLLETPGIRASFPRIDALCVLSGLSPDIGVSVAYLQRAQTVADQLGRGRFAVGPMCQLARTAAAQSATIVADRISKQAVELAEKEGGALDRLTAWVTRAKVLPDSESQAVQESIEVARVLADRARLAATAPLLAAVDEIDRRLSDFSPDFAARYIA